MAISVESFDIRNVIFEPSKLCAFGDIKYNRIPIRYRDGNRKIDLCIETPELTTFGIQENYQQIVVACKPVKTDKVESYSLPLIVSDRALESALESIRAAAQKHMLLVETKKQIKRFDLDPFVHAMDIFYRKKDQDDGMPVPGVDPIMYPKLLTFSDKKTAAGDNILPKIQTVFVDVDDRVIDPITLVGERAVVRAGLLVRDIYVGSKVSIQFKISDVIVVEKILRERKFLTNRYAQQKKAAIADSDANGDSDETVEEGDADAVDVREDFGVVKYSRRC